MLRTAGLCWRSTRALATCKGPSIEDVRHEFLRFFLQRGHVHVPSSSVVPTKGEPYPFTFDGGNQFKSIIQGQVAPDYNRVVNWQRCLQSRNWHVVGRYLHQNSFYEMLGNWSFNGAYSKREACEYAWEFLTESVKISPERIYVSYFGGSEELGIGPDTECRKIWMKIGYGLFVSAGSSSVPEDRILPFDGYHFLVMDPTGHCGPRTLLHVDRDVSRKAAQALVNHDDDSLVEVWGLWFVTHKRKDDGSFSVLPSNHVDTGMNLERLTSILQNVPSNFDTDAFQPIFAQIEALGGPKYTASSSPTDASLRRIADHLRGICVTVADGLEPGRRGRPLYLHRALYCVVYDMRSVGLPQGSSGHLVDTVFNLLIPAYPSFRDVYPHVRNFVEIMEDLYTLELKKIAKRIVQLRRPSLLDDCGVIPDDVVHFCNEHGMSTKDFREYCRNENVDMKSATEILEYIVDEYLACEPEMWPRRADSA